MDITTILGMVLGLGAVIGGQVLEGGHLSAILQPTAALIVLGGTFGATLISFPMDVVLRAFKDAIHAFTPPPNDPEKAIRDIVALTGKARQNGLISLEQEAKNFSDPFTRKGINLIADGTEPQTFRESMEVELGTFEEHIKTSPEFFEAAGGFAPTIGIIGAVLGLIHVMSNLSDASKLGEGIAVAFVATIYGLMTANIFCLPIATKLKHQNKELVKTKLIILEGFCSLQAGENPRLIEGKLKSFLHEKNEEKKGAAK